MLRNRKTHAILDTNAKRLKAVRYLGVKLLNILISLRSQSITQGFQVLWPIH